MKPSSNDEVRKMYEETADSYDKMMDIEIGLSVCRHKYFSHTSP